MKDRLVPGYQFPDEFVLPAYAGNSIANIPTTVAEMLSASVVGLPPLTAALWKPLADNVRKVVLLVVDGFGWNLLTQERERMVGLLAQTAVTGKLTSIFPSTTVAALTTLWTAMAPAQHGLVGLRLFMPEYATTTQMLKFTPTFGNYPDALVEAGLKPKEFLAGDGFAEQLTRAGVQSYALKGREIVDSALSQMHDRGINKEYGFSSAADMFVLLRQLLAEKHDQRLFVNAYWPMVDTLEHVYGWDHPSVAAELRNVLHLFETEFINQLSASARKDTAVFIVADHGQVICPPEQQIYLEDHPELNKMLLMRPSGEPRTAYLHAKHGCRNDIVAYINERLGHAMVAIPAGNALTEGLLGDLPHAPAASERVGDVIVTMRSGHLLLTETDREKAKRMVGRHGGMTADEMFVPWLGLRLD